ncbi:DNA-binding response regulator [Granulicella sp. 5B5]|uniref:response regulator transcription factor n=1 Tax=Granulicella sp. 5B5 TaxID=1617967 RepID=UPI0015F67B15|nr:response regulator transcription factor [Granulicella sp. 5B5]QMV20069.1 DNA-binding response regulator [Granulicella sp. 5B5]
MKSDSTILPTNGAATEESSPHQIRVILADSQAIYRVGMRKVFAVEDDIRVVAQSETVEHLYTALERFPESVVILEAQLLDDPAGAIPPIVGRFSTAKFIVQVAKVDEGDTVGLYRSGIKGVVPRSISPNQLVECVRRIAAGETWIDNQSISWVLDAYRAQAATLMNPRIQPQLSPKELVIIGCITRGMRNKEIASHVGTTEQVIKNYLRKIYDKLGVSDRLELALYCLHHQILKPDPDAPLLGSSRPR